MARGTFPTLNVTDLDRSLAFYKSLGLRARAETMRMPDFSMRYVSIPTGPESGIMLFARDFEGADPEDVAWASGDVGKGILLSVGVPNARKVYDNAKAAGARLESDLEPNPWGGHGFMLADPDGYYLMITDRFPPSGSTKKAARKAPARKAAAPCKKTSKKAAPARKGAGKSAKKTRR